ncbi:hypothetical protein EPA93_08675 [Ktedonosporobacter rubrisoli]|uniref:Uncharacterized protein n=1 Tax=Ktedonosporobacter rubrisoli TaxID=2509675 RepID=A0A4P6JMZ8_KTERU|nr:hypothetical protein [Ktedonosporobacter rubrisoli]QBD76076.1 hypothetical protein EPA93_08675 [Ktedonosporobacter rubrisoli]
MGLLAREIEAQGITTVALALIKELAEVVRAPRMLYLRWPFGHALGEPGNHLQQLNILHDMFSMASLAPRPGLIAELPYRWKRQEYAPIQDWNVASEPFKQALAQALAGHQKAERSFS